MAHGSMPYGSIILYYTYDLPSNKETITYNQLTYISFITHVSFNINIYVDLYKCVTIYLIILYNKNINPLSIHKYILLSPIGYQ